MSDLFTIRFDFDKAAAHPVGYGYDARPAGVALTHILLHSDEHQPGETFTETCEYGRDTRLVSWHYGIDVDGTIQRILDPGPWRAWHAGLSRYQGLDEWNDFSAGVELRHRAGEPFYPAVQMRALAWLCRQLATDHPTIRLAETALHRWVAINEDGSYGRKSDPTDTTDAFWHAWIAQLCPTSR